jgi:hypothetical protein
VQLKGADVKEKKKGAKKTKTNTLGVPTAFTVEWSVFFFKGREKKKKKKKKSKFKLFFSYYS